MPPHRPPPPELLGWVASQVGTGARVTAVEELHGGITAAMDRITVTSRNRTVEVVLRRWAVDADGPQRVRVEAAALEAVAGLDVPTPRLVATDDGTGTGVACTVTTALPGQPDLAPRDLQSWVEQLAAAQAAIHTVAAGDLEPTDGPGRYDLRPRPLDWITDPGLRRAAREAAEGQPPATDSFVHGDFQHFNVLWRADRLTGVVDWPHGGRGSAGTDVGHCRLNLAVLLGPEAAAAHLTAYERAAGHRLDRRADLRALLCFDLGWQEFIPRQVAGRAPLDLAGMADRVSATVRASLDGLG